MNLKLLKQWPFLHVVMVMLVFLSACVPNAPSPQATHSPWISPTVVPSATLLLPTPSVVQVEGTQSESSLVTPLATPSSMPEATAYPPPAATLIPKPHETMEGHEVVLRIHNVDKMTGRYGQLTRWLAWGSPAWTIAVDGSYWLIDVTNAQFQLVHLDPEGALLKTFPINARMMSDIVVGEHFVWVMNHSNDTTVQIVQVDPQTGTETAFTLPPKYQPDHCLTGNALSVESELLLECFGEIFVARFLKSQSELDLQELPGYEVGERVYRMAASNHQGLVLVDDQGLEVADSYNSFMTFLGTTPDGSFFVVGMGGHSRDLAAQHYASDGRFLGIARVPISYIYSENYRNLAVGPDGELYAMISQPDQDVLIIRLAFHDQIATLPTPTSHPDVMPTLPEPLRPAWVTPPSGTPAQEAAQETLIAFLSRLDQRQYIEAAELYGGGIEAFAPRCTADWEEACAVLQPLQEDPAQFWQRACSVLLACFSAGKIAEVEQISANEFRFWVELVWEEGTYAAHACCGGNPAITPFVWLFPFTVRAVDGRFQVMDPPPVLE